MPRDKGIALPPIGGVPRSVPEGAGPAQQVIYLSTYAKVMLGFHSETLSRSYRDTIIFLAGEEWQPAAEWRPAEKQPAMDEEQKERSVGRIKELRIRPLPEEVSDRLGLIARHCQLVRSRDHDLTAVALEAMLTGQIEPTSGTLEEAIRNVAYGPLDEIKAQGTQLITLTCYLSSTAVKGLQGIFKKLTRSRRNRRIRTVIETIARADFDLQLTEDQIPPTHRYAHPLTAQAWTFYYFARGALSLGLPVRPSDRRPGPLAAITMEYLGLGAIRLQQRDTEPEESLGPEWTQGSLGLEPEGPEAPVAPEGGDA